MKTSWKSLSGRFYLSAFLLGLAWLSCGLRAQAATPAEFGYNRIGAHGSRPLLVILANYPGGTNYPGARPLPVNPIAYVNEKVFNLSSTQSVNGYFWEVSNERFFWSRAAQGVIGPLQFSAEEQMDGNDPRIMATVVLAAMRSGQFDFAQFDANTNGIVTFDELAILIIGNKSGDGQWGVMRWANPDGNDAPYSLQVPGVSVAVRCVVSAADHTASFSTMAHEISHQLGTLDLYGDGSLNGDITLMDATIEGRSPDTKTYHLDPWHKMQLGWVEPRIRSLRTAGAEALPAPQMLRADAPVILYDPRIGTEEFFILEYRSRSIPHRVGYDRDVASEGMALWHIKQNQGYVPIPIPGLTGYAVVHESAPNLQRGGNVLWGSNSTVPYLRWLDGTLRETRIIVHPFNAEDSSIIVEWIVDWIRDEWLWVNFNYFGSEFGTFDFPFNTLAEGVDNVPWGGSLTIKAGSSAERRTIAKRMVIQAYGGPVIIGR